MTALEEPELDIVFETFTQDRNMESLDEYFAQRDKKPEPEPAPEPKPEPQVQAKKPEEKRPAPAKDGGKKQAQAQQAKPRQKGKEAPKAQPAPAAKKPQEEQKPQQPVREPKAPTRRVVDTRSSNVNIDRYNEKYDRLADQKVSARQDNAVTKQKFTNRNQQRRGQQRRGKRETEAERLRRIAMERKAKHITIEVPDEITVGAAAEGGRAGGHKEADGAGDICRHQRHHRL